MNWPLVASVCLGTLTISLTAVFAGTCEVNDGWVWTPFGTCYKAFSDQKAMWSEAQSTCMESEAHLMTLDTPEKIKFMKGRRTNKPGLRGIPHMWFGGRKLNDTWYWVSPSDSSMNKPIEEFDWEPGEPSGYGYKKNIGECLNVYGSTRCFGRGTQMDDDWCHQNHTFMCEKNQKFYKNNIVG